MKPLVGIIMGSTSDWETMRAAAEALDKLGIPYETKVVSAHRTPTCCSNTPPRPRAAASKSSLPEPVVQPIYRA